MKPSLADYVGTLNVNLAVLATIDRDAYIEISTEWLKQMYWTLTQLQDDASIHVILNLETRVTAAHGLYAHLEG